MSPSLAPLLLLLLVSGHILADFAFQTRSMVDNKSRARGLGTHIAVVFATHILILVPLLSLPVLLAVAAITAAHGLLDRSKAAFLGRHPHRGLEAFFADQLLHASTLLFAWWVLRAAPGTPFFPALSEHLTAAPQLAAHLARIAVVAAAFAFNAHGGSTIVAAVLQRFHLDDLGAAGAEPTTVSTDRAARGRAIGMLERWIGLTLILVGQWEALGFLLAAKSVARFRDLDDRNLSEHYLIGTLTSLLVVAASALATRAVLNAFPLAG